MEQKMNNNTRQMPTARNAGIVVRTLKDEVLIYDTEQHQAHCLNKNAAVIWEHCDGTQTVEKLSCLLNLGDGVSEHQKEQIVWIALDQLEHAHLLSEPVSKPQVVKEVTRRKLMRALGIAALISVPVVSTIFAPRAAEASTCLASGQACGVSAQCCSGLCSAGTCV